MFGRAGKFQRQSGTRRYGWLATADVLFLLSEWGTDSVFRAFSEKWLSFPGSPDPCSSVAQFLVAHINPCCPTPAFLIFFLIRVHPEPKKRLATDKHG